MEGGECGVFAIGLPQPAGSAPEQFRLRQDQLAGLDIILLVRGRVDHPDPAEVTDQLGKLFDKLLAKCGQA